MKLYDFVGAPNPKRVRVYLAEKGLKVPTQQVNILSGENRAPEFLAKNPMGGLPVLELDDGTYLPESLAIIEYLEDLHPTPPMIGTRGPLPHGAYHFELLTYFNSGWQPPEVLQETDDGRRLRGPGITRARGGETAFVHTEDHTL